MNMSDLKVIRLAYCNSACLF